MTSRNFNLPPTNNVYGERLLQFAGAKAWNKIPLEIKDAKGFPHALKKYLLHEEQ